jgi:hypothetical protein
MLRSALSTALATGEGFLPGENEMFRERGSVILQLFDSRAALPPNPGETGRRFFTNEPEQLAESKGSLEILVTNEPKNEPENCCKLLKMKALIQFAASRLSAKLLKSQVLHETKEKAVETPLPTSPPNM